MKKLYPVWCVLLIVTKVIWLLLKLVILLVRGIYMRHISALHFEKQLRSLDIPYGEAKTLSHSYKRMVSMNAVSYIKHGNSVTSELNS